jgi:hypothetical protein
MIVHSGDQIWSAVAPLMTGAAVMDVADRARHRVGAGTVGRDNTPPHPRVGGQPRLDRVGWLARSVLHDHAEPWIPFRRRPGLETGASGAAQRGGGAGPQAVVPRPGGPLQGSREAVRRVLARGQDLARGPGGPPGTAACGPHRESPRSSTAQGVGAVARLAVTPEAGPALDAVRIVGWGHASGARPPPAPLGAPAAPRLGGDGAPPLRLPRQGPRGTAPARAPPPLGSRGGRQPGQQRPPPRGDQHGGTRRGRAPPLVVALPAERPLPRAAPRAVDPGARAAQDRGDRRRVAARRPPAHEVAGQQAAVPRAPPRGQPVGVVLLRHGDDGTLGQGGGSPLRRGCLAMSDVAEAPLAVPIFCGSI